MHSHLRPPAKAAAGQQRLQTRLLHCRPTALAPANCAGLPRPPTPAASAAAAASVAVVPGRRLPRPCRQLLLLLWVLLCQAAGCCCRQLCCLPGQSAPRCRCCRRHRHSAADCPQKQRLQPHQGVLTHVSNGDKGKSATRFAASSASDCTAETPPSCPTNQDKPSHPAECLNTLVWPQPHRAHNLKLVPCVEHIGFG